MATTEEMPMSAIAFSKLPTNETPLIRDPDLARAIDDLLQPYSGKALERAQAAVRRVATNNGVMGVFKDLVEIYRTAILASVPKET
jgi:hypothetical protein